MTLTPAQVSELLTRIAGGEGVRAVLAEWGCDDDATLVWLRDNHHADLRAAKVEQRSGRVPMNAKARAAIDKREGRGR